MENNPKKSKALIITIIAILLIVLLGYLLIRNRDSFGVKTSASISRIFSSLIPSSNSKNINKIDENSKRIIAQAGEDILSGDNVFLNSSSGGGNPIAMLVNGNNQSQSGDMFGFANEDINNGDTGEIIVNLNDGNTFWESFTNFLNNLFKNNPGDNVPTPPGGWTFDGNNWTFDPNGNGGWVFDPSQNIWTPPGNIVFPPPGGWTFDGNNWTFDPNGNGGWVFDPSQNIWTPPGGWTFDGNNWTFDPNGNGGWGIDPDTGDWTPPQDGWGIDPDTGDWTYNPVCSDTKDNDGDNLIDTLDPNCHVDGDLNKAYIPTHYSESSNPPGGGECANGATNYPICDDNQNGLPDLKAGAVTPTRGTVNNPIILSSSISNIGSSSTGGTFSAFFNITTTNPMTGDITNPNTGNGVSRNKLKNTFAKIINKIPWVSRAIGAAQPGDTLFGLNIELKTTVPIIFANNSRVATVTYSFATERIYYIRACADKNGANDPGVITESNENNNCGPWTTFTVTNSLPVDGDLCLNGADNYPVCTTKNGMCLNGATNPPVCTVVSGCTNGATNPPLCDIMPIIPEINKCLLIDKNPLTFTDSEKAELATLLRKFYLIAPNLKTEDDINIIYSEIDNYNEFASQLDNLINQCYDQGINRAGVKNPNFRLDPVRRYGNPWFKYAERTAKDVKQGNTDSVYMDYNVLETEGPGCKVVRGYFSGETRAGEDCDIKYSPAPNCWPGDIDIYIRPAAVPNNNGGSGRGLVGDLFGVGAVGTLSEDEINAQTCKWNPGTYFTDYEKVLNIW